MFKLLLATTNPGKLREFRQLFQDVPVELVALADLRAVPEVIEDGDTFEANAIKKAVEMAAATGMAVMSDDSGLEVDALGGAPGVHSARYAGEACDDEANNLKLVRELAGVPDEKRLRKACGRAQQVLVYSYGGGNVPLWWQQNEGRLKRCSNLTVINLPSAATKATCLAAAPS